MYAFLEKYRQGYFVCRYAMAYIVLLLLLFEIVNNDLCNIMKCTTVSITYQAKYNVWHDVNAIVS